MRQHDKSIVTSVIFLEKIDNEKVEKLQSARVIVHNIANKRLKEEDIFVSMPFECLSGIEYYGDFNDVSIKLKRVIKKDKVLVFDILVPMDIIIDMVELEEEKIIQFYLDLFNSAINLAIEKYQINKSKDK